MIELIKGIALGTAQAGSGGGGQTINNEDMTITSNGTYTASEGYTGIGTATVNVGSLVENFDKHGTLTFQGDAKLGTRTVSGFSASNYLTTKDVVDWGTGAWNIHFRFIHHSSSGVQALIANSTNVGSQGISATIDNDKFKLFLSSNGSSNDILNGGSSTYTFSDSVEYDLDIWFTGSAYGFTVLPHDNSAGTSESLVTSSSTLYASTLVKAIGNNLTGSTNFFQGTIYLDDLTIKTNAFDWVAEEVLASESRYGATIGNFLGDVDANGIMQKPISPINLSFNGVKSFGSSISTGEKMSQTFYQNKNVGSVSFSDLEDMSLIYGLSSTFSYSSATSALFPKLKTVTASSAFDQTFMGSNVSEIDFSSLTSISGSSSFQNTFQSCKMTSVSFPELTSTSNTKMQSCFNSCTNLTSVSFPKLTSVSFLDTTFAYCTSLTSVSFPELASITATNIGMTSCFRGCSSLASISFPKLSLCNGNCFQNTFRDCTSLTSVSFPALKSDSFGSYINFGVNMLQGVTGCTVHFPSNLQSVIGSWSDVTSGFGGTNTTVLYDLPATE